MSASPDVRWTPAEEDILRRTYHRGSFYAMDALAAAGHTRSRQAVFCHAKVLGLNVGSSVLVAAREVHPHTNGKQTHPRIIRHARQAGVLCDYGPRAHPRWYVPESWAIEYMEELGRSDAALRRGWWTDSELADYLGVSQSTVSRAAHGIVRTPLARFLQGMPHVVHPQRKGYLWDGQHVMMATRKAA